jgi:hypothetical protein
MNDFCAHYFEALGTHEQPKLKDTLARAHEIRKFEIELYWKRATYFWAFQLVAFTALGLLFKAGDQYSQRLIIPGSIGVITGFAGYLTARGSKFWQENWEKHIDVLEQETKERLTQVIIGTRPPQFSVSRTNQSLLLLLTYGWGVLLLIAAIPQAVEFLISLCPLYRGIGVLILVMLACGWMWWSNRTYLTGRIYIFGETTWTEYPSKRKSVVPFIIWRDPIGEEPPRKESAKSLPDT